MCTMHLLFYNGKAYVQLCVFEGSHIFEPERQSLLAEFIRRICNFARFGHPGGPEELSDSNYKEKIHLVQSLFDDFRTKKMKSSQQSRGQGNWDDQRTSRAGGQDTTRLTQMGYNLIQVPYEMYQSDSVVLLRESSSDQVVIAKRTTAVEVKLIKSLLSARSNKYENHTIAYKHVLQLSDVHVYLIMPYYSDLSSLKFLSSRLYLEIRFQLIEGVAFMHEQGVVHRDIKPSNVVVELKEYRLFIIDYDLSQHQSPGGQCFGYCGTEGWTAPEIQPDAVWDPWSADIWALANVIRYLAKRIGYSDSIIDTVLRLSPAERPSAEKLLELYSRCSKRGLTSQEGLPFPKRPHPTV
ncbi:NUAK SNF1-like kinase 1 [Tulasnella sp. 418]|nr:NUAK SNF1-like kinase 1 [Tulasnella sp. 418]